MRRRATALLVSAVAGSLLVGGGAPSAAQQGTLPEWTEHAPGLRTDGPIQWIVETNLLGMTLHAAYNVQSIVPAVSVDDPTGDFFHATGESPGIMPPEIDATSVTILGHLRQAPQTPPSGSLCGTSNGAILYCDPAAVDAADWSGGAVLATWQTAAPWKTTPGLGLCELTYGVNSTAGGTPWQSAADFPNDGFRDLTNVWGMRIRGEGTHEFFSWGSESGFAASPPGVVLSESASGTSMGLVIPASLFPDGDPSLAITGRIYMFCAEEEGNFDADQSASDWIDVEYDNGYPAFTVSLAPAVDPSPVTTPTPPAAEEDDGGGMTGILPVIVALIVAVVGGGLWFASRRKQVHVGGTRTRSGDDSRPRDPGDDSVDPGDDEDPRDVPVGTPYGEEIDPCCKWSLFYETWGGVQKTIIHGGPKPCATYTIKVHSRLEESSLSGVNHNGLGDVLEVTARPTSDDVGEGRAQADDGAFVQDATILEVKFESASPHTSHYHCQAESQIWVDGQRQWGDDDTTRLATDAWVTAWGAGDLTWEMQQYGGDGEPGGLWNDRPRDIPVGGALTPETRTRIGDLGGADDDGAPELRGQMLGGALADIDADLLEITVNNHVAAVAKADVPASGLDGDAPWAKLTVDSRHWMKVEAHADCDCDKPWCEDSPAFTIEFGQPKPFPDLEDQQSQADAVIYARDTVTYLHRSEKDPDLDNFPFQQGWAAI